MVCEWSRPQQGPLDVITQQVMMAKWTECQDRSSGTPWTSGAGRRNHAIGSCGN